MQEIARGIYLETLFPGVTLGAISLAHGLVLVDAPPRPDDARTWRSMLLNLGGGVDRLLVNLDGHYDRTLGARSMECTVVAHEKTGKAYQNRPATFKGQVGETGAEWELISGIGPLRWAPPELTFTHSMTVHWGEEAIHLEYHPGPDSGAIWALIPGARVAFIGDVVIPDQPPFLAEADLDAWMETLELLLSPLYGSYFLVGGRSGLVPQEQVRRQIFYLREVSRLMAQAGELGLTPEAAAEEMIPPLLRLQDIPASRREQYSQRLRWGLCQYLRRDRRKLRVDEEIE